MSPENKPTDNRSEQLRQRRSLHSQQRMKHIAPGSGSMPSIYPVRQPQPRQQTSHQGTRPVTPVITRNGRMGQPLMRNAQTQVRKRFAIPLGTPGAQMVFPSLPILHPGWRILSGTMVIFCLVLLLIMGSSSQFRVMKVALDGIQRISPLDATMALNLTNIPVYMVDPQQATTDLERLFPELYDVSIRVMLPDRVVISAHERQPAVAWEYNKTTLWIDSEGYVFPQRSGLEKISSPGQIASGAADQTGGETAQEPALLTIKADTPPPAPSMAVLPKEDILKVLVTGKEIQTKETLSEILFKKNGKQKVDMEIIHAAQKLSAHFPPETALVYSAKDGLGWADSRGWNVYIGSNLENLDLRMAEYKALVDKLAGDGVQPVMISVRYLHAPFFRVE